MPIAIHIMGELRPSGMEKMFESSNEYWTNLGWELIVVGCGKHHPFAQSLKTAGYKVFIISKIKSLTGMISLIKLMRKNSPDIIHNHSEAFHGFISLTSRFFFPKTPIVRTIHNCFQFNGFDKIKRNIQHVMETISGVIRVSPSVDVQNNELVNWNVTSIVIENWIDVDRINEIGSRKTSFEKKKQLLISIIGNCSDIKNHDFALEVLSEFEDLRIFHIGRQAQITNKELSLLSSLHREGKLLHDGPLDSALEKIAMSDLHILPSLHEGMGLVIAESVVSGVETWIRDVPGVQWARGLPGVRYFTTQSELREMISEKLNYNFRQGQNFSKLIHESERFNPARGVREYIELYESLMKKN